MTSRFAEVLDDDAALLLHGAGKDQNRAIDAKSTDPRIAAVAVVSFGGWLGLSFPTVITRREVALRYGFPPEHPAREDSPMHEISTLTRVGRWGDRAS
jgi:hypothetical protein